MKNIRIKAEKICSEIQFFEFINADREYVDTWGSSALIARSITSRHYFRMGEDPGNIHFNKLNNMDKKVLSHIMFFRRWKTGDCITDTIPLRDVEFNEVTRSLDNLTKLGLIGLYEIFHEEEVYN